MVYAIMILAVLSLFLIFYTCTGVLLKKNNAVQIRLDMIGKQGSNDADNELNQPLFVRVLRPMMDSISKTVLKITPKEIVASMEKKVMLAGKSNNLTVKGLVNIQVIIVVGLPILTLLPRLGIPHLSSRLPFCYQFILSSRAQRGISFHRATRFLGRSLPLTPSE